MFQRRVSIGWLLACLLILCGCTWVIAGHAGEVRERHRRCERERELIAPVLADPAFARLEVLDDTAPGGGILLLGPVKTRADLTRLRAEIVRPFGEPRADTVLMLVY